MRREHAPMTQPLLSLRVPRMSTSYGVPCAVMLFPYGLRVANMVQMGSDGGNEVHGRL